MCQPDLDFLAPEVQSSSACSPQSDMFSLGLLICSIYNNGRSPIESNFSSGTYFKQLELVSDKDICLYIFRHKRNELTFVSVSITCSFSSISTLPLVLFYFRSFFHFHSSFSFSFFLFYMSFYLSKLNEPLSNRITFVTCFVGTYCGKGAAAIFLLMHFSN